jgi:hypothetical protein
MGADADQDLHCEYVKKLIASDDKGEITFEDMVRLDIR